MLQSSPGRKWKKCEQTLPFIAMHYWGYTSLEVKGRWGLLLPPCLLITVQQPGTSSPPSWFKRSSAGIIWMCGASFTSSAMVQYGGLLPVDRVVLLPCMLRYHRTEPWLEDRSCWWRRPCTSRWYLQRSASTETEDWLLDCCDQKAGREEQSSLTWLPMNSILSSAWL